MNKKNIHIGIGGWNYEPWRGTFYPPGLPQRRELEYASRKLTSIEINSTYYGSQKPESFAKWRDETPEGFVFAVKGPRFATNRRVLAEAGTSIERFFTSGVMELREKLGPINWQFLPTKKFEAKDFEEFLKLLPRTVDGRAIRHAIEFRHESCDTPEFLAMLRDYGVAIVLAADSPHPRVNDSTAPFIYARLMGTSEGEPLGYAEADLQKWADQVWQWTPEQPRDVFLYVISGFKTRNPAAAMAILARLPPGASAPLTTP
jgi:uncharacterized protein YecE (DUF72 family)